MRFHIIAVELKINDNTKSLSSVFSFTKAELIQLSTIHDGNYKACITILLLF